MPQNIITAQPLILYGLKQGELRVTKGGGGLVGLVGELVAGGH